VTKFLLSLQKKKLSKEDKEQANWLNRARAAPS
jgi:hypothetical protein